MRKDPLELVGVVIDGAYRVESLADEGDLSLVYKGHHLGTDAVIGIRCLNLPTTLDAALAGPFAEAFREGSRLHYKLGPGNPNFVQTMASGTTVAPSTGQEVPYEVREWLEGRTLAAFLEKRNAEWAGGWPLAEALELLAPIANGLAYEHAQGVFHGAVHPANLFVVETSGRPALKILDFGEGRKAGEKAARETVRVLTPQYAAPEQVDKQVGTLGPWTDVYALAVLVLDLLTGRLPSYDLPAAVLSDPKNRPSPKKLGLALPTHVEHVLERALSVDPTLRQTDAETFWHDLTEAAAAASEPAVAKEPAGDRVKQRPMAPPLGLKPRAETKSRNPFAKATLLGIAPQRISKPPVPPSARPKPMFPTDESPTRKVAQDAPAMFASSAPSSSAPPPGPEAREAVRAKLDLPSAPPPPAFREPEVFAPPIGDPSLLGRLVSLGRMAMQWARTEVQRGIRWARAEPSGSVPMLRWGILAGGFFGTCLVLALLVRACIGETPAKVETSAASSALAAASAPSAAASAEPSTEPQPAAAPAGSEIELADDTAATTANPPAVAKSFTRPAASAALAAAAGDLASCRSKGNLWGPGSARVAFSREGTVMRIAMGPPYNGTPEGDCVRDKLRGARMTPFRGPVGAVNYTFNVPQ